MDTASGGFRISGVRFEVNVHRTVNSEHRYTQRTNQERSLTVSVQVLERY